MTKLVGFAETSKIMDVAVQYKEEKFEFNLDAELKISESSINSHLKGHVRGYAFLSMLHVKLKIKYRDQGKRIQRLKSKLIYKYKPLYKTVTEAEAVMYKEHKELREMEDDLLRIEELRDIIEVCVRSFESRKDLLQSLSANNRKER